MKTIGTMVSVNQICDTCSDSPFVLKSEPLIFGKYPAGNVFVELCSIDGWGFN